MPSELQWDPEIDTPATIAIIGAGPGGIEAALYARFLGYSVELYDQHRVCDSLRRWGQRPMSGTWCDLTSPLGLAALQAHSHPLPEPGEVPTCLEYVKRYLLPLIRSDLLHDSVNHRTRVLGVSRQGCGPWDELSVEQRADQEFRLLLQSQSRGEFSQIVDIVLDCSGSESVRRGLASGGGQPIGWAALGAAVSMGKQDFSGRQGQEFRGRRVLLFGNDAAAAANAVELYQRSDLQSQLYWVLPKRLGGRDGVLDLPTDCGLLSAAEAAQAEQLYRQADSVRVVPLAAWGIESIQAVDSRLRVTLQATEEETLDVEVDRLIHCGQCLPEFSYRHNLRLEAEAPTDPCVMREPHFYLLGGRAMCGPDRAASQPECSMTDIRQQIRRVFGMIGGRAELDLYATVRPQAMS